MSAGPRPDPEVVAIEQLSRIIRGRTVVLGVGNALKADDAAGCMVAEALRKRFPDRVFDAGETPENFVGPIRRAEPDTVIVVDAADFGGEPGEIRIVAAADVRGLTLGTHALPLGLFMEAVAEETGADVHLVAIQAEGTELGGVVSPAVAEAIERVVAELEFTL